MSKPAVRIAAGDWWDKNGGRIGIYNANYVGGFVKYSESKKPWTLASAGGADLNGENFATHAEATAFVREHLSGQAVSE